MFTQVSLFPKWLTTVFTSIRFFTYVSYNMFTQVSLFPKWLNTVFISICMFSNSWAVNMNVSHQSDVKLQLKKLDCQYERLLTALVTEIMPAPCPTTSIYTAAAGKGCQILIFSLLILTDYIIKFWYKIGPVTISRAGQRSVKKNFGQKNFFWSKTVFWWKNFFLSKKIFFFFFGFLEKKSLAQTRPL